MKPTCSCLARARAYTHTHTDGYVHYETYRWKEGEMEGCEMRQGRGESKSARERTPESARARARARERIERASEQAKEREEGVGGRERDLRERPGAAIDIENTFYCCRELILLERDLEQPSPSHRCHHHTPLQWQTPHRLTRGSHLYMSPAMCVSRFRVLGLGFRVMFE